MRWDIKSRRAEWAMDVAAAAIFAAAVGFAVRALAVDADLASSAATIAFMLVVAILRHETAGGRRRPGGREFNAGVARTVRRGRSMTAAPDASQALSDALAELRRSLR